MDSTQLPFSLPDLYQGLATSNGVATATADGLTLEFEIKDSIVGVLKSEIRNIEIPIGELYSIGLENGWLGSKVFIRTKSMVTLSSIPGNQAGQIALRIARKFRTAAAGLVSILKLRLSERELATFERQGL